MATPVRYIGLRIANVLGFVATVVVNALANALPLNGYYTGELSDMYPNLFVPAGLTFAIWGVIYLLLGVFVIYQLSGSRTAVPRIGLWFVIASLANCGWIFAWHFRYLVLSLIAMGTLLGALIRIYAAVEIGKNAVSRLEKYCVHITFGVYLGWISVATIANITAFLVDRGWSGFGLSDQVWAIVMVLVSVGLALLFLAARRDIFYALVIAWALFGIIVKQYSTSGHLPLIVAAAGGMGVVLAGILFRAPAWISYPEARRE